MGVSGNSADRQGEGLGGRESEQRSDGWGRGESSLAIMHLKRQELEKGFSLQTSEIKSQEEPPFVLSPGFQQLLSQGRRLTLAFHICLAGEPLPQGAAGFGLPRLPGAAVPLGAEGALWAETSQSQPCPRSPQEERGRAFLF